jgi:hypothetical protein
MKRLSLLVLLVVLLSRSVSYGEEPEQSLTQATLATHWMAAFDALTERDMIVLETSYLKNPASDSGKRLTFRYVTKLEAVGSLLIVTHRPTSSRDANAETIIPAEQVVAVMGTDTRTHTEISMDLLKEERAEAKLRQKAKHP